MTAAPDNSATAAYLAARSRGGTPHSRCVTPAHRLRRALLWATGSPCHLCGSTRPTRIISTRTPSWDTAAASAGHAALLRRTPHASRIAAYAAAAASPRVKTVCPACLRAARVHSRLEALAAACHGPNTTRAPLC